mgnify:CR=1 FL=1
MNRVDGKYALVTGGTQGLGAAIARCFADNGAKGVITIGRNENKGREVAQKIKSDTGCDVIYVKTDLAKVEQCRNAVSTAKKEFGKLDILVNAAGITDRGDIINTSEELFDKMISVNVKGPYFLIQDTVKIMIEQKIQGSIINIGSVSALTGQPFISAYSTSKGALATLTRNVLSIFIPSEVWKTSGWNCIPYIFFSLCSSSNANIDLRRFVKLYLLLGENDSLECSPLILNVLAKYIERLVT